MSHKNTTLPGIRQVPALSESSRGSRDFDENTDMVPVPMDRELARIIPSDPAAFSENEHHYIKLHGSFNWMSTSGSNAVVIGYQQDKQIENEPLLDRYFDLFKKVLFLPNRKLMIIGYGFREPHINRVIADAVENKGLRVYVISPRVHANLLITESDVPTPSLVRPSLTKIGKRSFLAFRDIIPSVLWML